MADQNDRFRVRRASPDSSPLSSPTSSPLSTPKRFSKRVKKDPALPEYRPTLTPLSQREQYRNTFNTTALARFQENPEPTGALEGLDYLEEELESKEWELNPSSTAALRAIKALNLASPPRPKRP